MEQFHKGITAVGRDFVKLQRVYLPDRALYEVVEFYYNVWKLKQLPVSRGWALREAEVRECCWWLRVWCVTVVLYRSRRSVQTSRQRLMRRAVIATPVTTRMIGLCGPDCECPR